MSLKDHNKSQIEAAMGADNKWHASRFHGYEVTDPELLLQYFIRHGGAEFFGKRRGLPQSDCSGGPSQQSQS